MRSRSESVACATAWALAIIAALTGAVTVVVFGCWGVISFQSDPPMILAGIFWLALALAVPTSAEVARRVGRRRGVRGQDLLVCVSAVAFAVPAGIVALIYVVVVTTLLIHGP
jgi:hypothetical protein